MKLEGRRSLLGALALLPLLAGVALASGPVLFVCGIDHVARPDCCCPDAHSTSTPSDGHPTLTAACCCDVTDAQAPATPAAAESRAVQISHLAATAPAAWTAASSPPAVRAALSAGMAQPPPTIPILLAKQSFLA
jgi:hypothetical protein